MYLESDDPKSAEAQLQPGEFVFEMERFPAFVPTRNVRMERNSLLTSSDWTQMPDSPLSDERKQEWADYRKLLRDYFQDNPDAEANPDNVIWPQPPGAA